MEKVFGATLPDQPIDEQIGEKESFLMVEWLRKIEKPLTAKLHAELKRLDDEVKVKKRNEVMPLLRLGTVLASTLKTLPSQLRCQREVDATDESLTPDDYLERLTEYCGALKDLQDTIGSFLSAPSALMHHVKRAVHKPNLGVAVVGAGLGAFVGAMVFHAKVGLTIAGLAVAAPWMIGGAIVGLVAYGVYYWFTTPKEKTERAILEARVAKMRKSTSYKDITAFCKEFKRTMVMMPGMDTKGSAGDDGECVVCFEKLEMCTHIDGRNHAVRCSVLAFQCDHVMCYTCALKPEVVSCSLCQAEKVV